ncbi:unnamed protein product, partial [marine sediment metagenome]
MNGGNIKSLLEKYGTGLEETRLLLPELVKAVQGKRRPAFPTGPQFLSSDQAKEWGFELEPGWMLKVTPLKVPIETEADFTFNLRSPGGEDIPFEDVFV